MDRAEFHAGIFMEDDERKFSRSLSPSFRLTTNLIMPAPLLRR